MARKTQITVRIDNELVIGLMQLANKSGLSKSDIMVFALSDYLLENAVSEEIEGVDLKKLAEHVKMAKLREIRGIFRNEMLSGAFFIKRVRKDLLKLISEYKGHKEIRNIIEKYINIRKSEAVNFIDNSFILAEFEKFEQNLEISISRLKNYIENTVVIEK